VPAYCRLGLLCEWCERVFEAQPCFVRPFCSGACRQRSLKFSPARFWAKVDKRGSNECWLWLKSRDKDGYGRAFDGKRMRQAHDVAWELSTGRKLKRGRLVRHTCDNPPCCNDRHLLEGTHKDNTHDAIVRGRKRTPYIDYDVPLSRRPSGERSGAHKHPEKVLRGEACGSSRIARRTVRALRRAREVDGLSYPALAKKFGLSISQTYRIVLKQSWNWLI